MFPSATRKHHPGLLQIKNGHVGLKQPHQHHQSVHSSSAEDSFDSALDSADKPNTPTSKFWFSSTETANPTSRAGGGGGAGLKKSGDNSRWRRSYFSSLTKSCDSSDSSTGSLSVGRSGRRLSEPKTNYRIMVLGSPQTGKTSIIRQFLYDKFSSAHRETVDDMYRGEFELRDREIGFDIQDVSGSYAYQFPAMLSVSLASADAFVLVFSLDSADSWEQVSRFRDLVQEAKGSGVPIVVAANKCDLAPDRSMPLESLEATVIFDWENGFVECSAKEPRNINKIFKELLQQAKATYDLDAQPPQSGRWDGGRHPSQGRSNTLASNASASQSPCIQKGNRTLQRAESDFWRRRQSLPAVQTDGIQQTRCKSQDEAAGAKGLTCIDSKLLPNLYAKLEGATDKDNCKVKAHKKSDSKSWRRSSLAVLRKDSCKIS